ncbi:MAG: hypothetical protein NVSMB32_01600 [Actinomycetota bacterium]
MAIPVGGSEDSLILDEESGHVGKGIHMPSPSYWPFVAAVGLPLIGWGMVFNMYWLIGVGILAMLVGLFGWVFEPLTDPGLPEGGH